MKDDLDLISCCPPNPIQRNEFGLIKGLQYHFDDDGFVNWKKMLKTEHLVVNKKKNAETDISKVPEEDLLILLSGIKYLASIRGFQSVDYHITATDGRISSKCTIVWTPNYETEGRTVSYASMADASIENTSGFTSQFLTAISENRSFIRAVRNFLKIPILGQEELPPEDEQKARKADASPHAILQNLLDELNKSFEWLKSKIVEKNAETGKWPQAEKWDSIKDLSKMECIQLTELIKKSLADMKKKAINPK